MSARHPGFTTDPNLYPTAPYTAGPQRNPSTRNAPSVRSRALPPITAPAPGPLTSRKTATSPAANPFYFSIRGPGSNTAGS